MRTTAGVSVIGVAGCLNGEEEEEPTDDDEEDDEPTEEEQPEEVDYEVWAIDQGTNTGYVYAPDGEGSYEEYDTIDFNEVGGDVPHMVDFSSDYEYAVVGCTGGARAAIVRTEDHEIVDDIETGDGSHFASFTPDDEFIQVDVIGEGAIKPYRRRPRKRGVRAARRRDRHERSARILRELRPNLSPVHRKRLLVPHPRSVLPRRRSRGR